MKINYYDTPSERRQHGEFYSKFMGWLTQKGEAEGDSEVCVTCGKVDCQCYENSQELN